VLFASELKGHIGDPHGNRIHLSGRFGYRAVTALARRRRAEPRILFSGTRIAGKRVLGIESFAIRILSCQVPMAETKKTVVARLFAEHRGALQAFPYRRVRCHGVEAETMKTPPEGGAFI